ncbi:MAG: hypothetical protein SPL51_08920 [Lachnospiraceae bacterium]|nr:hypothetical protein [Lachnospiraceae bacterium]
MEDNVKNNADAIIFHTDIGVAGVTNIYYRRAKFEILLSIPTTDTSAEWRKIWQKEILILTE